MRMAATTNRPFLFLSPSPEHGNGFCSVWIRKTTWVKHQLQIEFLFFWFSSVSPQQGNYFLPRPWIIFLIYYNINTAFNISNYVKIIRACMCVLLCIAHVVEAWITFHSLAVGTFFLWGGQKAGPHRVNNYIWRWKDDLGLISHWGKSKGWGKASENCLDVIIVPSLFGSHVPTDQYECSGFSLPPSGLFSNI